MSTKEQMATSFSWNTLTVVLQVVIQLAYTGLLARMVSKDSFMLMGIVLGIMGFAEIFSQVGVGPALVQRKEVQQQHINGAFYTALLLGLAFTLLFIGLAPAFASFYQLPELRPIIMVVCSSFTISAIAVVPRSMMMKHMRFKTMFKASMISIIGGNLVVGLTLAYLNWNVWAYVWALFAQNALMTLALWYYEPVRIDGGWEWKYTRELIRYGAGSTLFNAFNYLATKLDVLLVPRVLRGSDSVLSSTGRDMASYFERASYAMTQPITIMGKLSDSVLFSGMSRMQDDHERLQKTMTLATNLLTCVLLPATAFIAFYADELIGLWLGREYLETAIILKALFPAVVFRSLSKLGDSLLRAKDSVFQGAFYKAAFLIFIAVGITLGARHGTEGIAWGIFSATFLHYLMNMHLSTRLIELSGIKLLQALLPGIALGALTFIGAWTVHLTTTLLMLPAALSLLAALTFVPLFPIAGVWLYPNLLGPRNINPLAYLPARIAQIAIIRNLVARLK